MGTKESRSWVIPVGCASSIAGGKSGRFARSVGQSSGVMRSRTSRVGLGRSVDAPTPSQVEIRALSQQIAALKRSRARRALLDMFPFSRTIGDLEG